VVTIERPELADKARAARGGRHEHVEVQVGDGSLGVPERSMYRCRCCGADDPPASTHSSPRRQAVAARLLAGQPVLLVRSPMGQRSAPVPCRFVPLLGEGGFTGA
jgi:protein-L-isoaspartate O-methyltransferase